MATNILLGVIDFSCKRHLTMGDISTCDEKKKEKKKTEQNIQNL